MSDDPELRTTEDIERAIRALAREFNTDTDLDPTVADRAIACMRSLGPL